MRDVMKGSLKATDQHVMHEVFYKSTDYRYVIFHFLSLTLFFMFFALVLVGDICYLKL